jgi:hypothetical protein
MEIQKSAELQNMDAAPLGIGSGNALSEPVLAFERITT